MAITVADNFLYKGKKPLDAREQFDTVSSMKGFSEDYLPEGFKTYCVETNSIYEFKSSNTVDPATGKWREVIDEDGKVYDGYYTRINQIKDSAGVAENYAWEVFYDDLNYPYAYSKFEDNLNPTGCSSYRRGNFYGRNLDWVYNEDAEFIIHTPNKGGRNATLCTCGQISKLSAVFVSSGVYAPEYVMVPFYCTDGINEHGLFVNVNVVPAEVGNTTGIIYPTKDTRVTICANMIPRYILDYCNSADEAVDFIQKHMTVYFSKKLRQMGYEPHFMIGDKNKTYIVEFHNNMCDVLSCDEGNLAGKRYMTNFHLYNVRFNVDDQPGAMYYPINTPDFGSENPSWNRITSHGSGLERYNDIYLHEYWALHSDDPDDEATVKGAMDTVKYTNAYNPSRKWYTEFVGIDGLTVDSIPIEFEDVMERAKNKYLNRSRDPQNPNYGTWQTTHSVIYNIEKQTAEYHFQERNATYEFSLIRPEKGLEVLALSSNDYLKDVPEGSFFARIDGEDHGILTNYRNQASLADAEGFCQCGHKASSIVPELPDWDLALDLSKLDYEVEPWDHVVTIDFTEQFDFMYTYEEQGEGVYLLHPNWGCDWIKYDTGELIQGPCILGWGGGPSEPHIMDLTIDLYKGHYVYIKLNKVAGQDTLNKEGYGRAYEDLHSGDTWRIERGKSRTMLSRMLCGLATHDSMYGAQDPVWEDGYSGWYAQFCGCDNIEALYFPPLHMKRLDGMGYWVGGTFAGLKAMHFYSESFEGITDNWFDHMPNLDVVSCRGFDINAQLLIVSPPDSAHYTLYYASQRMSQQQIDEFTLNNPEFFYQCNLASYDYGDTTVAYLMRSFIGGGGEQGDVWHLVRDNGWEITYENESLYLDYPEDYRSGNIELKEGDSVGYIAPDNGIVYGVHIGGHDYYTNSYYHNKDEYVILTFHNNYISKKSKYQYSNVHHDSWEVSVNGQEVILKAPDNYDNPPRINAGDYVSFTMPQDIETFWTLSMPGKSANIYPRTSAKSGERIIARFDGDYFQRESHLASSLHHNGFATAKIDNNTMRVSYRTLEERELLHIYPSDGDYTSLYANDLYLELNKIVFEGQEYEFVEPRRVNEGEWVNIHFYNGKAYEDKSGSSASSYVLRAEWTAAFNEGTLTLTAPDGEEIPTVLKTNDRINFVADFSGNVTKVVIGGATYDAVMFPLSGGVAPEAVSLAYYGGKLHRMGKISVTNCDFTMSYGEHPSRPGVTCLMLKSPDGTEDDVTYEGHLFTFVAKGTPVAVSDISLNGFLPVPIANIPTEGFKFTENKIYTIYCYNGVYHILDYQCDPVDDYKAVKVTSSTRPDGDVTLIVTLPDGVVSKGFDYSRGIKFVMDWERYYLENVSYVSINGGTEEKLNPGKLTLSVRIPYTLFAYQLGSNRRWRIFSGCGESLGRTDTSMYFDDESAGKLVITSPSGYGYYTLRDRTSVPIIPDADYNGVKSINTLAGYGDFIAVTDAPVNLKKNHKYTLVYNDDGTTKKWRVIDDEKEADGGLPVFDLEEDTDLYDARVRDLWEAVFNIDGPKNYELHWKDRDYQIPHVGILTVSLDVETRRGLELHSLTYTDGRGTKTYRVTDGSDYPDFTVLDFLQRAPEFNSASSVIITDCEIDGGYLLLKTPMGYDKSWTSSMANMSYSFIAPRDASDLYKVVLDESGTYYLEDVDGNNVSIVSGCKYDMYVSSDSEDTFILHPSADEGAVAAKKAEKKVDALAVTTNLRASACGNNEYTQDYNVNPAGSFWYDGYYYVVTYSDDERRGGVQLWQFTDDKSLDKSFNHTPLDNVCPEAWRFCISGVTMIEGKPVLYGMDIDYGCPGFIRLNPHDNRRSPMDDSAWRYYRFDDFGNAGYLDMIPYEVSQPVDIWGRIVAGALLYVEHAYQYMFQFIYIDPDGEWRTENLATADVPGTVPAGEPELIRKAKMFAWPGNFNTEDGLFGAVFAYGIEKYQGFPILLMKGGGYTANLAPLITNDRQITMYIGSGVAGDTLYVGFRRYTDDESESCMIYKANIRDKRIEDIVSTVLTINNAPSYDDERDEKYPYDHNYYNYDDTRMGFAEGIIYYALRYNYETHIYKYVNEDFDNPEEIYIDHQKLGDYGVTRQYFDVLNNGTLKYVTYNQMRSLVTLNIEKNLAAPEDSGYTLLMDYIRRLEQRIAYLERYLY